MHNEVTEEETTRFLKIEDDPWTWDNLTKEEMHQRREEMLLEAWLEGIWIGEERGTQEMIQNMLSERFSFEQISEIAEVPQDVIYNIAQSYSPRV